MYKQQMLILVLSLVLPIAMSGCEQSKEVMAQSDRAELGDAVQDVRARTTEVDNQLEAQYLQRWYEAAKHKRSRVIPQQITRVKQTDIKRLQNAPIHNNEAVIPPQCYTKHDKQFNPCMTCHQNYSDSVRKNYMNDGALQHAYAFSDVGVVNHWQNLFEDRTARIKAISDQTMLKYIFSDNYTPLIKHLEQLENWNGAIPKIANLHLADLAFDEQGFALDGSQWVAFNYKPVPSTFWPTNGSTDDVMLRLPSKFRMTKCQQPVYSRAIYRANLALLEMAIKDIDQVSVAPIDEALVCEDLNGDETLSVVEQLPRSARYFGQASKIDVIPMLYPKGVEFMHTVRYVGYNGDGDIFVPPRMKELRYMKKVKMMSAAELKAAYYGENKDKTEGKLPSYVYRPEGSFNEFGWQLLGFIESEQGALRLQNHEETAYCMGCHRTIGATIDQTFSFARKVKGAKGWGYINLKGMPDAPTIGRDMGEIEHYLKTVGGGDEFRQNSEMIERWFNVAGEVKKQAVEAADVYTLITPSIERAAKLNKAYMTIVQDQDFNHGRDANIVPARNVYSKVDGQTAPVLPLDKAQQWDLRLDWSD